MSTATERVFLLSPASCSGRRAQLLLRDQAAFDLAVRLRNEGLTLGQTFSFLSGLYFRGKLAYAEQFAQVANGMPKALVITAGRGLMPATAIVRRDDLVEFASVPIAPDLAAYRDPLRRDALQLADRLGPHCQVVLLGSVATAKYREVLGEILADRLYFPAAFVGRGDMSRGGLMLRCVAAAQELEYIPMAGAVLRGRRPKRLDP
jgi:hypothetical protein